jgi:hypothetical protein
MLGVENLFSVLIDMICTKPVELALNQPCIDCRLHITWCAMLSLRGNCYIFFVPLVYSTNNDVRSGDTFSGTGISRL